MISSAEARTVLPVPEAEYLRLLGFPPDHQPADRAHALMGWARSWYAGHGRPWMEWREVSLELAPGSLRLDDRPFPSSQLHEHLRAHGATRAVLVAVSAGAEAEAEARRLYETGRPDEYFFLEAYASAVVERLTASVNGRLCDAAAREELLALPHLSPGYTGWDVSEQPMLLELLTAGGTRALPGPLEVLESGMLRPKKSLLAVVGLSPHSEAGLRAARLLPCERCAFAPCAYRRASYRSAPVQLDGLPPRDAPPPAAATPTYTLPARALRRWADERIRLEPQTDGTLLATFRFDGTTCSNMGRPLAFDYRVRLSPAEQGHLILEVDCRPADGDTGHRQMCAYLADKAALVSAIAAEKPLLGRPLGNVFTWERASAPAGCLCESASRMHKWALVFEVIHFAVTHPAIPRSLVATPETIPT